MGLAVMTAVMRKEKVSGTKKLEKKEKQREKNKGVRNRFRHLVPDTFVFPRKDLTEFQVFMELFRQLRSEPAFKAWMKEKGYSDPKPDELRPGPGSSPSILREYEDRLFEDYLRFARAAGATEPEIEELRKQRWNNQAWANAAELYRASEGIALAIAGGISLRNARSDIARNNMPSSVPTVNGIRRSTAVIGSQKVIEKPLQTRTSEYRLGVTVGSTFRSTWRSNYGELRKAMGRGLPIRDATPDLTSPFLRLERFTLEMRGWTPRQINGQTFWVPPGYRVPGS